MNVPDERDRGKPPDLHAAYDANLVAVGRLNDAMRTALLSGDRTEHDRLAAELQTALADRHALESAIAEQWLRGLRLAARIMPHNVKSHLGPIVDAEDLDRRLAALEQHAAETEVALEDAGVFA